MMQPCHACLRVGLLLSCHPVQLQLCEPQDGINVKCSSDPTMTTPSSLTSTHSHVQRPPRRAHRQLRRWVAAAAGGRAGRPAAAPSTHHPVSCGHRRPPSPLQAVRGPSVAATWNPPLLYLFLHLLCFIPFVLYTGIKDLIRKA